MERDKRGRYPVKPKYCLRCKRDLPRTKFGKDVSKPDKRRIYCLECEREMSRQRVVRRKLKDPEGFRLTRNKIKRNFDRSPRGQYWGLKYRARQKGMGFEIDKEGFVAWYENQKQICHYCKLPFHGAYRYNPLARTIDRKDNNNIYTLDNIVLACRRCNTVKGDAFTEQEMLEIAQKYLYERYGSV